MNDEGVQNLSGEERWRQVRTERLVLERVKERDTSDWFEIHSDPRLWSHFPSGRHTARVETEQFVRSSIAEWERDGLGYWSVREQAAEQIIGCGGCRAVGDGARWNLYYRFRPESHGRGYATELAQAAIEIAHIVAPERPIVAYMLEHNEASWRIAEKIGLTRIWVGPDEGNPDPDAIRYVYADRTDVAFD